MEEVSGEAEEEPQLSAMSENEEGDLLTEEVEKDVYTSVEGMKESPNEKEEKSPKEMPKHIDPTQIQLAADCTVVKQRTRMNYSKEIIAERLEKDSKLCQEKSDEIDSSWSLLLKAAPVDLQKDLNEQKQLYDSILQCKDELINELQLELRKRDKRYVKNTRKRTEEMDLLIKAMEDQINKRTKEVWDQIKESHSNPRASTEDSDSSFRNDMMAFEQSTKNETITEEGMKMVEIAEEKLKQNLQKAHEVQVQFLGHILKKQALQSEFQQIKNKAVVQRLIESIEQRQKMLMTQEGNSERTVLQEKVKHLKSTLEKQRKAQAAELNRLSKVCKKKTQEDERISMLNKNSNATHSRRLKDMERMIEEKVEKLAERALLVDAAISKQVFGSSRKRLQMDSSELPGPSQAQKPAPNIGQLLLQTEKCSQEKLGPACSLDPDTKSPVAEMFKEKMELEDSGPGWEERKLSRELQREEKKLLCDKKMKDSSEFEARIESLANVIPQEKVKLWKETEIKLKQHHAVLRDTLTLKREADELEQKNQELKKSLQQRLKCDKMTKN